MYEITKAPLVETVCDDFYYFWNLHLHLDFTLVDFTLRK